MEILLALLTISILGNILQDRCVSDARADCEDHLDEIERLRDQVAELQDDIEDLRATYCREQYR
jgi:cell division protein FtsB